MSMIGTVLRFDTARGFGFVAPADGSPDVFVHESDILAGEPLMKGDKISFDTQLDDKKNKMIAVNCNIVEYSPSRPRQVFVSCVSDQSRLSTISPMHYQQHHAPMMSMAPTPVNSPQNEWEQQQFFMMQQQQQFFEQQQAQMMDHQFCMQPQHNFIMAPTTITTVMVDDLNMMMQ